MNKSFRTEINVPVSPKKIHHQSQVLMMGSCFTENIGDLLQRGKFQIDLNPFGILYNPISVNNALQILIHQELFSAEKLFFYNEKWTSFYHHGSFSNTDQTTCLQHINQRIEQKSVQNADFLVLTFGTAYVYEHKKTQQVVANCHKLPHHEFKRYLLTPQQMVEGLGETFQLIREQNKNIHIVLTISPIRHWQDGAVANQHSKASLILAVQELLKQLNNISYFPSYELVLDDLRDYRFYDKDMLHPNELAINYIWNKFKDVYFSEKTNHLLPQIQKLQKACQHRPENPNSQAHQQFIQQQTLHIKNLQQQHSFLEFTTELKLLNANKT